MPHDLEFATYVGTKPLIMSVVRISPFVFVERICAAPIDRVFAAFSDPDKRVRWGAPSEKQRPSSMTKPIFARAASICSAAATKATRSSLTTYHDIVPNAHIISSEVVEAQGRKLLISMSTTTFEPEGTGTKVVVTVQLTSLAGEDMLTGAKFGHNASLDNLVKVMQ